MFKPTSALTSPWYSLISSGVILIIPVCLDFDTAVTSGIFVRIAYQMCMFALTKQELFVSAFVLLDSLAPLASSMPK